MNLIELKRITHFNKVIKVYYDPNPINPRTEYDNVTTMVYWTNKYIIGDEYIEQCTKKYIEDEYASKNDRILAILPLNAYIHSGITISTGNFSCKFDSGQVGFVFITESKAKAMGYDLTNPPNWENVIQDDVLVYDNYLTGQVYGYVIENNIGDQLESCWGFIGDVDYCILEAKSVAESCIDPIIFGDNLEEHF